MRMHMLMLVRATEPSGLVHAVYRPLICLVLQGSKLVTMGTFAAGDSQLVREMHYWLLAGMSHRPSTSTFAP